MCLKHDLIGGFIRAGVYLIGLKELRIQEFYEGEMVRVGLTGPVYGERPYIFYNDLWADPDNQEQQIRSEIQKIEKALLRLQEKAVELREKIKKEVE